MLDETDDINNEAENEDEDDDNLVECVDCGVMYNPEEEGGDERRCYFCFEDGRIDDDPDEEE